MSVKGWILAFVGGGLIIAALIGFVYWDNVQTEQGKRQDARDMNRVNTICGSRPSSVDYHGASWSLGPWWEVKCQDGSTVVVKMGGSE